MIDEAALKEELNQVGQRINELHNDAVSRQQQLDRVSQLADQLHAVLTRVDAAQQAKDQRDAARLLRLERVLAAVVAYLEDGDRPGSYMLAMNPEDRKFLQNVVPY